MRLWHRRLADKGTCMAESVAYVLKNQSGRRRVSKSLVAGKYYGEGSHSGGLRQLFGALVKRDIKMHQTDPWDTVIGCKRAVVNICRKEIGLNHSFAARVNGKNIRPVHDLIPPDHKLKPYRASDVESRIFFYVPTCFQRNKRSRDHSAMRTAHNSQRRK